MIKNLSIFFAFFTICQVAYRCLLSYYYFWVLSYLLDRPSKKDFPKISENGLSEKCFDFASGFLLSRINSNVKNGCFKLTLGKYIIHLPTKSDFFRPTYENIISQDEFEPKKNLKIGNWQNWCHHIRSAILAHSVLSGLIPNLIKKSWMDSTTQ